MPFGPETDRNGPTVTITLPAEGYRLPDGAEVLIQSMATDARGVTEIELYVDGQLTRIDVSPESGGQSPYVVSQPWRAQGPGEHTIVVRAISLDGRATDSEPLRIFVQPSAAAIAVTPSPSLTPALPADATETPTATPVRVFATVTPPAISTPTTTPTPHPTQVASEPTPAPASPPPTPTVSPTARSTAWTDTGLRPEGRFLEIWNEIGAGRGRLGFPLEAAITDRNFAKQYFEGGFMYWLDRPGQPGFIWVFSAADASLEAGSHSARFEDAWSGGERLSCEETGEQSYGPVAGFGKIWCDRPEVRTALGAPLEPEAGSSGNPPFGLVQFFQGGVLLDNPLDGEVWVAFSSGDWRRISYK